MTEQPKPHVPLGPELVPITFGTEVEGEDHEAGQIECLDDHGQGECSGPVEFRTTPDRDDLRHFPRCEAHFAKRLDAAERTADLRGDVPPSWFDPAYAGERWDED